MFTKNGPLFINGLFCWSFLEVTQIPQFKNDTTGLNSTLFRKLQEQIWLPVLHEFFFKNSEI